ncbi:MAG: flagellar export chaperone FliS [Gammaproteobacteria bacterium]|nr:flagellar export chaperone FliS [Gammaproteobacteria bacterium]MCP5415711.1 flagellar export chaperone FliS [Chromatiaceae bacterium]
MNRSRISNALSEYNSISVTGGVEDATPHRLIQMLMEGALDKIATAKGHILHRDMAEKGRHISWAISIVGGLQNSLDMEAGGEISANLDTLYDYMIRRLVEAGVQNDPAILDEVSSLLLEVKSAWDVIPRQLASESRKATS